MGWPLLCFLQASLPLQVKKPRKRDAKAVLSSQTKGLVLTGCQPAARAMPRLRTDIQAANRPDRSARAAAAEGWAEPAVTWHSTGHLLGTALNTLPSVWGGDAATNYEVSAGSFPRGRSAWQQGRLGAAGKPTGFGPLRAQIYWGRGSEDNGMGQCLSLPACPPWAGKAPCGGG